MKPLSLFIIETRTRLQIMRSVFCFATFMHNLVWICGNGNSYVG